MVRDAAVRFLVLAPAILLFRGAYSVLYLLYVRLNPSMFLDVHLPIAVSSGIVAAIAASSLKRPGRVLWWLTAWASSSATAVLHVAIIEYARGVTGGIEYWNLLVAPWLLASALAALLGTIVFARPK